MTRLEALKWCFENIIDPNNNHTTKDVSAAIGAEYWEELELMGFVFSCYDWENRCSQIKLTDLGKAYCEEIFNQYDKERPA